MQPLSNVPLYANCFDQLTTNGIIAEDLMGYVTGTPSPYLQNYVAQRGGVPNLPGQMLPDTLTPAIRGKGNIAQNQTPLPKGDIYNVAPKNIGPETLEPSKNRKIDTAKKIAAGILLAGLATLGIVKGKSLFVKAKTFFKNKFHNPSNISFKMPAWTKNVKQAIVNGFNKVCNFFKGLWNKIFHKTPTP